MKGLKRELGHCIRKTFSWVKNKRNKIKESNLEKAQMKIVIVLLKMLNPEASATKSNINSTPHKVINMLLVLQTPRYNQTLTSIWRKKIKNY